MPYSWEDVMLTVDVGRESEEKAQAVRDIEKAKAKEEDWMAKGSLAGSLLCGALWGPAGAAICSNVAKYGIDFLMPEKYGTQWEEMEVPTGKFHQGKARRVQEDYEQQAKDQTWGQLIGTATDLASMWMQAGGPAALKAGEAVDYTTFGHGPGKWSVFGKGTAPIDTTGMTGGEVLQAIHQHYSMR